MKFLIKLLTPILLAIFFAAPVRASHVTGSALYYTHIADSTYRITLELYLDCTTSMGVDSVGFNQEPLIWVVDTLDVISSTYLDTPHLYVERAVSGQEVPRPCFAQETQCTGTSGTVGIKKFIYSALYTLNRRTSKPLYIAYAGFNEGQTSMWSGRKGNLINTFGNGDIIWLHCLLNTPVTNSCAIPGNNFQQYYCVNNAAVYTPGYSDADGDSIVVSIVPPMSNADQSPVLLHPVIEDFKPSYSASMPFAVQPGSFRLNSSTGSMSFTPSIQQQSVVDFLVQEYRNGVLTGSSMREHILFALPCKDSCTVDTAYNGTIRFQPNPANDQLDIWMTAKPYNQVTMYDALGRRLLQVPITTYMTRIFTDNIVEGIYLLVFDGAAGRKVDKVLIQH